MSTSYSMKETGEVEDVIHMVQKDDKIYVSGGVLMSEENIHLDCENYNAKKDMCLKWFEEGVSKYNECAEKRRFSDTELQRKWSN